MFGERVKYSPAFTGTAFAEADLATRMLFSCLIDADRLDTAAHMTGQPNMAEPSLVAAAKIEQLLEFVQRRAAGVPEGAVKAARQEVLDSCLTAAGDSSNLFCTATLPAFEKSSSGTTSIGGDLRWPRGTLREVIPQPQRLFDKLRRVRVRWPEDHKTSAQEFASQLIERRRVLCIVNTRDRALGLFRTVLATAAKENVAADCIFTSFDSNVRRASARSAERSARADRARQRALSCDLYAAS